ncbi:MAG: hypothetical protein GY841_18980 [FCB group bacterium]|nr:hypothetical protein [FCB group bacterium]
MTILRFLYLAVLLIYCLVPLTTLSQTFDPASVGQNQSPTYLIPQIDIAGNLLQRMQIRFLDTFIDPDQYIVGPGDKLGLFFTSSDIGNVSAEIKSDGYVFIKSVGSLKIGHVTLRRAIEIIIEKVKTVYTNTEFGVRLTGYRVVRLNVIGEVAHPGIYYAPAIWRVSEILDLAGGVTSRAAVRKIALRGLGDTYLADLTRFTSLGDTEKNPMICKGNIIDVSARQVGSEMITMAGRLNQPGVFEHTAGDCLADYIAFAGGLNGNQTEMEFIISTAGREIDRLDGAAKSANNYELKPGNNVKIEWKDGRRNFGTVGIFGAVIRPGRYVLDQSDLSLQTLLDRCGGESEDGCPEMIRIFRTDWIKATQGTDYDGINITGGLISRNPRQPWNPAEFMLLDGDSVFIPHRTGMVAVSGAVASPGLVRFSDGQGIGYYLKQVGGLGFDADKSRMVVINPATGGRIDASDAGDLFDSEILFVPQKESQTKP